MIIKTKRLWQPRSLFKGDKYMKTIVITGSTSGIGKELVKIFSQDNNWHVFCGI